MLFKMGIQKVKNNRGVPLMKMLIPFGIFISSFGLDYFFGYLDLGRILWYSVGISLTVAALLLWRLNIDSRFKYIWLPQIIIYSVIYVLLTFQLPFKFLHVYIEKIISYNPLLVIGGTILIGIIALIVISIRSWIQRKSVF